MSPGPRSISPRGRAGRTRAAALSSDMKRSQSKRGRRRRAQESKKAGANVEGEGEYDGVEEKRDDPVRQSRATHCRRQRLDIGRLGRAADDEGIVEKIAIGRVAVAGKAQPLAILQRLAGFVESVTVIFMRVMQREQ